MSLAQLKAYGQLIAAAGVAFIGLAVGATAIGHAIDPDHIGLWSGERAFFFGAVYGRLDGMFRAHQLPGSTLYIVTVMVVGICFFVSRELFGFARAGLRRQPR
jgi:hypothetical protein